MTSHNGSLLYGFDYDKKLLLDVTMCSQTILPVINILFLHPAVLLLVSRSRNMSLDIRIGYCSTVIGLMIADSFIFGLRAHLLAPYSGLYCGGPLCTLGLVEKSSARVILALSIICCFPSFVFLTLRMHQMVLRGSDSSWLLSMRSQVLALLALLIIILLNPIGFALAEDSKNADVIKQTPELEWLSAIGGYLFIFGDFGKPEAIKFELVILFISIACHAPFVIAFSLHSIRHLKKCRKSLISSRTLQMTKQMLEIFHCQLKGAILHILLPIVTFAIVVIFDTTQLLPDSVFVILRLIITMLFITNPLQFSLVFIVKMKLHHNITSYLKTGRGIAENLASDDQKSVRSSINSTPLLPIV